MFSRRSTGTWDDLQLLVHNTHTLTRKQHTLTSRPIKTLWESLFTIVFLPLTPHPSCCPPSSFTCWSCTGMSNSIFVRKKHKRDFQTVPTHTPPSTHTKFYSHPRTRSQEITRCLAFVSFHFLDACLPAFLTLHQEH